MCSIWNFIERQEETKDKLQREVKTLKEKVRSLESKIRRIHLKSDEEDDDIDPKRQRCVMTIPVERCQNFH